MIKALSGRRDLLRVAVITVCSGFFGVLYGLVLVEGVRFGLIVGLLNGVMIGILDTLWVRRRRGRRLRGLPLLAYLLILTLIWTLIISLNMALVRYALTMEHALDLGWIWHREFWSHFTFCLIMAFTFNLLLRVIAFLGSRSLLEILLGRYQEPAEEQLAFLFLDVADSTRLTEQLGSARVQQLIGELFFDIAGLVDRFGGEVHRYVGDQMVVTWNLARRTGVPDIVTCLREIYRLVEARCRHSEAAWGGCINLRAGANAGRVLVSEIGDLKRELVYFGDAINVAAGLQGHCKELGVRALMSEPLYRRLVPGEPAPGLIVRDILLKNRVAPVAAVVIEA